MAKQPPFYLGSLGLLLAATCCWASLSSPALAQVSAVPASPGPQDRQRAARPTVLKQPQEATETIELIELRRFAQARKKIDQALATKPRDPLWRFLLGTVLAETGETQKAIGEFESLTQTYPELAEPYNNLAVLYLQIHQPERAREALERAILNRPDYGLAYENLGDLYVQLALAAYRKSGTRPGGSPMIDAKREYLENIPSLQPRKIIPKPQTKKE